MSGIDIPEPARHQQYTGDATGPAVMCLRCGSLVGDTDKHDTEHWAQDRITRRVVQILDRRTTP